jgi:hypothetical protein
MRDRPATYPPYPTTNPPGAAAPTLIARGARIDLNRRADCQLAARAFDRGWAVPDALRRRMAGQAREQLGKTPRRHTVSLVLLMVAIRGADVRRIEALLASEREREAARSLVATDVTLTEDTFIAEVAIDEHRVILVYLRQHGGRSYVRWRVFHQHRKSKGWYPDRRRAFVVPVGVAGALAEAIANAPTGHQRSAKPHWLEYLDTNRRDRLAKLMDLNAPPCVLDAERRRLYRGRA